MAQAALVVVDAQRRVLAVNEAFRAGSALGVLSRRRGAFVTSLGVLEPAELAEFGRVLVVDGALAEPGLLERFVAAHPERRGVGVGGRADAMAKRVLRQVAGLVEELGR